MLVYSRLLRRADKIIFGCKYQLERWTSRYTLPRSKCEYIYNGVDEDWYSYAALSERKQQLRQAMGLNAHDFIVGTVGQLRPEKQHTDFILAVERLGVDNKKVCGVLVGDGPMRQKLEAFVNKRNLAGQIMFLGQLADVRLALETMDVFVLTSADETFSNAVLEAMSMSKPVVLSDVGGAQEMVRNGRNGYLYEQGNVEELVALLEQLMRASSVRLRLGQNARRTVVEKFAFSRMVDQYEKLLLDT